jgi:hypothetical protein
MIAMKQSALEEEIARKLAQVRSSIAAHDRGVLLGFLLSVLPIFPVAFFGLLISVFNYTLWKNGKLDIFERGLIRKGIFIGLANSILGVAVLVVIINLIFNLDWHSYPLWIADNISWLLNWLHAQREAAKGMVSI